MDRWRGKRHAPFSSGGATGNTGRKRPPGEAGYLHKLCVRREFAHRGMTARVVEALREVCRERGARFLRLDTGCDEPVVRDIYLAAGFRIVKTLERGGRPVMLLYELEVR